MKLLLTLDSVISCILEKYFSLKPLLHIQNSVNIRYASSKLRISCSSLPHIYFVLVSAVQKSHRTMFFVSQNFWKTKYLVQDLHMSTILQDKFSEIYKMKRTDNSATQTPRLPFSSPGRLSKFLSSEGARLHVW